jgi:hypothetical protein
MSRQVQHPSDLLTDLFCLTVPPRSAGVKGGARLDLAAANILWWRLNLATLRPHERYARQR